MNKTKIQTITMPAIDGLVFRTAENVEDIKKMYRVYMTSEFHDSEEPATTEEDMVHDYQHLVNSVLEEDVLVAEVNGEMVAYSRCYWRDQPEEKRTAYGHFGFVIPEWRDKGIGTAMVAWGEERLKQIAASHTDKTWAKIFKVGSSSTQVGRNAIYEKAGYKPENYFISMVRPNAAEVPDKDFPEGLEIRPYREEDFDKIHDAHVECFRDHVGFSEPDPEDIKGWKTSRWFQPHLWCVVWDGDEPVASMFNYINEEENTRYNRKRGWTEDITVIRRWRNQGVARAMITWSIRRLHQEGMEETALGVHTENPSGALHLYESMGYEKDKAYIDLVKPIEIG